MKKFTALAVIVVASSMLYFLLIFQEEVYARTPKQGRVEATSGRKNVLMIIADDLRPQLGVYQDPGLQELIYHGMKTPNLDALAGKSLFVRNAFAQYSVCAPSRSSVLTSRRPQTTRVYDLHSYWRTVGGNYTTLPQYFKEQGYLTQGVGKVFHHGASSGGNNDAQSWTHRFLQPINTFWKEKLRSWISVSDEMRQEKPLLDDMVLHGAEKALKKLSEAAEKKHTHFFLAVGFYKPHLPWVCPSEFYSKYPRSEMDVAPNKYAPKGMPSVAGSSYLELLKFAEMQSMGLSGAYNDTFPDQLSKELRRAYYACVSYIDHQIGQLLGSLKALGLEKDTVVAFWGDHGFLLGDQGTWGKHSLFELAARVPLMLRVPGITDRGLATDHLVELVDLFPTLVDVAGLPPIEQCPRFSRNVTLCTEGSSFAQLLNNPSSPSWKNRVFMEQERKLNDKVIMGRSVRTKDFRYTEWAKVVKGSYDRSHMYARELYNIGIDKLQTVNVVEDTTFRNVVSTLEVELRNGWSDTMV